VLAMENSNSTSNNDLKYQLEKLSRKAFKTCKCDLTKCDQVEKIFEQNKISVVIHLAAVKGVSDSIKFPVECYKQNMIGMINLLEEMKKYDVKNLIFSSSCAVYGDQKEMPVDENAIIQSIMNPYAKSKYFIEEMLRDYSHANVDVNIAVLRIFNPVGSHDSSLIGENPENSQISFLTLIALAALKKRENITIFGSEFNSVDGTMIRDFIDINDLSNAFINVLKKLELFNGIKFYNVGSGRGQTLLQLINAFERVNNVKVPYVINKTRRSGEMEKIVANTTKICNELDWQAEKSIELTCLNTWKWVNFFYNNNNNN
jgi:UDP-glucose 4-epimerase